MEECFNPTGRSYQTTEYVRLKGTSRTSTQHLMKTIELEILDYCNKVNILYTATLDKEHLITGHNTSLDLLQYFNKVDQVYKL